MKTEILLYAVILVGGLNGQSGQVGLLFTSNWSGASTDINPVINLVFLNFNCQPFPVTYNLLFITPGLSYLSTISAMNTESTRLSGSSIKYAIGETNNFLNFIYNPATNPSIPIINMYPSDSQLLNMVIISINSIFDPALPKQGIVVILKRTNDINNLNVGNYANIINQINQLAWYNVLFLDYQSADNVVYQLRLNPYYNIISLLTDPADNRDLIQKAYMANLMVWKYRWIIVNLLGEYNPLSDSTLYGNGVISNNVTVITFADFLSGNTGRTVLLQDTLKLVRSLDCETNKPLTLDYTSGVLFTFSNSRSTFRFAIYKNPGLNASQPSYITMDSTGATNFVTFPSNMAFTPFSMNPNTSLTSTQAKVFRIGFVNYPPYSFKVGNNYSGFVIDVLVTILTQMNVSYTIVDLSAQYSGLNSGTLNTANLTYNQLLGLVQNNVVDTLSFLFIINSDMMNSFDFSSPILPGFISVLYKNRTYTGMNALVTYSFSFDWNVWITFLGSAIGVALALAISDYIFPDKFARYRILMSLFFAISSMTHGAYFDPPKRIGGRVIMSFWWLFCLVVVIIWACNYAAFLAQMKYSQQLINIFSLLNQRTYTYGTLNDGILFNFLRQNNQSDPQSMLQIMSEDQPNGTVSDFKTAVDLVTNNNYCFIYADRMIQYLRNTNCLDMFGNWMGFEYGIVLPKNSEKTLAINNAITQNRANGKIDILANRTWPVYNETCLSTSFVDQMNAVLQSIIPNFFTGALDIRIMIGVFVILIAGSVCSLVLALVERFIRQMIQIRKDKHDKYEYDNTVEQLTRF